MGVRSRRHHRARRVRTRRHADRSSAQLASFADRHEVLADPARAHARRARSTSRNRRVRRPRTARDLAARMRDADRPARATCARVATSRSTIATSISSRPACPDPSSRICAGSTARRFAPRSRRRSPSLAPRDRNLLRLVGDRRPRHRSAREDLSRPSRDRGAPARARARRRSSPRPTRGCRVELVGQRVGAREHHADDPHADRLHPALDVLGKLSERDCVHRRNLKARPVRPDRWSSQRDRGDAPAVTCAGNNTIAALDRGCDRCGGGARASRSISTRARTCRQLVADLGRGLSALDDDRLPRPGDGRRALRDRTRDRRRRHGRRVRSARHDARSPRRDQARAARQRMPTRTRCSPKRARWRGSRTATSRRSTTSAPSTVSSTCAWSSSPARRCASGSRRRARRARSSPCSSRRAAASRTSMARPRPPRLQTRQRA